MGTYLIDISLKHSLIFLVTNNHKQGTHIFFRYQNINLFEQQNYVNVPNFVTDGKE